MKASYWIGRAAATAVVAFTAGCHNASESARLHGEEFAPEGQPRAFQTMASAQAAAGARADATLYPDDFEGSELNSAGRSKVDLMLDADPASPLVIYLDLPAGTMSAPARQSVMEYVKGRGLPASQVRLQDGPNPAAASSAADALTTLQALQTQSQATLQQPVNPAGSSQPPAMNH